jgi:hypothetical protein
MAAAMVQRQIVLAADENTGKSSPFGVETFVS